MCIIETLNSFISESAVIAIPAIIAALLIPIVFFILERHDFYSFDKNIVLDKILRYKLLILLIVITSVFLIIQKFLFLAAFSSIILIIFSMFILYSSYKWLRASETKNNVLSYRQKRRIEYIKGIKSDAEIVEVWNIILYDEKLLEKNQTGFIEAFVKTLERYEIQTPKNGQKNRYYNNLLNMLNQNLGKINFAIDSAYENLVTYLLSFYDSEKPKLMGQHIKSTILFNILKYSLQEKQYRIYDCLFFEQIQKYFNDKKTDKQNFILQFYPSLLNTLEQVENIDIDRLWEEDFLKTNIITKEKLDSEQYRDSTSSLLKVYNRFLFPRLNRDSSKDEEYNIFIDKITQNLLPAVDPILWIGVLSFYIGTYYRIKEGEDKLHAQIIYWCKRKRNFGYIGRSICGFGIDETQIQLSQQDEEKETIYILRHILHEQLNNKEELGNILNTIKKIRDEKSLKEDSEVLNLDELEHNTKLFLLKI